MQEKKLGRGLDFLLNISNTDPTQTKKIEYIELSKIKKNRYQPRDHFDDESLKELSDSISQNGLLQPILLRQDGDFYEIIAGERRFQACLLLSMKTIQAIVLDVPENHLLQLALIENIQRENLNPIEEAKAYQTILKLENLTHEDLATKVGKKRSTVTNSLRLLELPEEIQAHVSRGTLSPGHARAFLASDSKEEMTRLFNETLTNKLSVRSVESLIKNHKRKKNRQTDKNQVSDLESLLMEKLTTRVKITNKNSKGTINIYFTSKDDFQRIYNLLIQMH